jgi:hypothetical protein
VSKPLITVIINTYRENPVWLRAAIRSYKVQKDVEVQIIVSCVKGDPNIAIIKSMGCEVVLNAIPGIYQQINAALPFIKGEYMCYGSSNDMAADFKLRSEYDCCVTANKLVCFSSFYKCDVNLHPITTHQAQPYDYATHLKGNYVNDCALVHASLIKKYAPFRLEWQNHAYFDLWLRIYEGEGNVFIHNPTPTWFYRGHAGLKLQRQRNKALMQANRESRHKMLERHKNRILTEILKEVISDMADGLSKLPIEGVNEGVFDVIKIKPNPTSFSDLMDITHFVYVYVQSPARWNELAVSIASIRKHFQGKAKFFCVGDPPGVKDVVHIPVVQIKGRGCKPKDAIAKLKTIINCPLINEDFVYCYDDVILLRPIKPEWFDKTIANEYVKDYTTHWQGAKGIIPDHGWRGLFLKTFAILTKKGLPTWNGETHLPRKLNKIKIQQTLDRFGEAVNETLFNSLYLNQHYEKPDIILKENNRIKAGLHRAFDNPDKLIGEIKGRTWVNYSDPFLNELARKTITKIMKGEIKV